MILARRLARAALPLTALALLGVAPSLPPMSAEETVAANTVRAHVEFLADDRLEGRDMGSRGHEPLLGLNDYRGLDVRGKIVVALGGTPDGLSSEITAHLASTKDDSAARHGAIGFVEIARDPRNPGRIGGVAGMARRSAVDWVDSSGRSGNVPQGLRARLAFSPQWQERLFDGAARSLAAVRAQAKGVARPRGFPLATRLSITADSKWEDFTSPEVIGRLPGADPARSAENVVLMAHLDHLGVKRDAKPGEDAIYNGALDNAAGVATMLEAAREFVASGTRPARSVLFIANTGEEKGLLGADYFASHPTVPIGSIASVVDLDMPLPLYNFTDVIAFGADHSTVAQSVAEAGRSMGIGVSADPMPQESIFVRSDHYRFVSRGVPAILLMTGFANGGEAVWKRFLAHTYHSPSDDLGQPIEWRALARYGMLNYRIARALADAPMRPRWYAGDYFGDRFAPSQARALRRSP
ncbi:MAG: M20/M25/M40 family metallo-hydrolase [Sphingomonadales bacterium]|nr:M20/M25/M40 family metallo-hydrolase [Sphingomonadales bacterium]